VTEGMRGIAALLRSGALAPYLSALPSWPWYVGAPRVGALAGSGGGALRALPVGTTEPPRHGALGRAGRRR
jgi:hypothetical protein